MLVRSLTLMLPVVLSSLVSGCIAAIDDTDTTDDTVRTDDDDDREKEGGTRDRDSAAGKVAMASDAGSEHAGETATAVNRDASSGEDAEVDRTDARAETLSSDSDGDATGDKPDGGNEHPDVSTGAIDDQGRAVSGPLVVQITTPIDSAIGGTEQMYFITVGNTSAVAVDDVTVQLRVPDGLEFHYQADSWPNSQACGNASCTADEEANWVLGTIPAGTTRTIQYNPTTLEAIQDDDAIVSRFQLRAEGLPTINLSKTVPLRSARDVDLALTSETDPIFPGQTAVLNLDLGQIGDLALEDVELQLELPASLEAVGVSNSGTAQGGIVTWTLGDVGVEDTRRRSVTVRLSDSATPGDVLNPRASVRYTTDEAYSETAQLPLSVVAAPLPMTLTVGREMTPGSLDARTRYVVTVANRGQRELASATLYYRQPPEQEQHYQADTHPNSASCGNATCSAGEEVLWELGAIAPGATRVIDINSLVLSSSARNGSLITSHFELIAEGMNPVHVSHVLPVKSDAGAQLSLKTSAAPAVPGQELTFEVDLGQMGPTSLNETELTLLLPAGVSVEEVNGGGSETTPGTIVWNVGTVDVAASDRRTVSVKLDEDLPAGTALKATAVATFAGGAEIDATADYTVSVSAAPFALTASVETTPNVAILGDRLLYTTTIHNDGARNVNDVSLLLRVPAGLSYHYQNDATPNSASCGNATCSAGEESVFTIPTILAGTSETVTINVSVLDSLIAGSLIQMTQQITSPDVAGELFLKKTLTTSE